MSRRKGALERGYKNLFDYTVRRLNLSEGSVALRLQVANVSRRFPPLLVALAENRMSLTVAGLLAPHLTEENVEKLIAECSGMTKREAEEHLVALRPKPVFTPSIRRTPFAFVRSVAGGAFGAHRAPGPGTAASTATLSKHPSTGDARQLQFSFRRKQGVQGQVRAAGGSARGRESLAAHGGDSGKGRRHRARQKGPEEKARAAAGEASEATRPGAGRFSSGRENRWRGAWRLPPHRVRGSGARPRARRSSMRIRGTGRDAMSSANRASDRAR